MVSTYNTLYVYNSYTKLRTIYLFNANIMLILSLDYIINKQFPCLFFSIIYSR